MQPLTNQLNTDEKYMHRCIQLAENGLGTTYPNPLVGSVIVLNDTIIGEGWHQKSGQNHAEINAIESVKNKENLKNSTIYVNLEPCSHFGKTPPCSESIINFGFKRIVIGCQDENSIVNGKGIQRVKNAGIEVILGVLENECKELNKRFFTFHTKKRPYIVLKYAQSFDGFLDVERSVKSINESGGTQISNNYSLQLVHKWRSEEHAILVGTQTVLNDNPKLNVRHWKGFEPIKLIIDKDLKISLEYAIFSQDKVWVFHNIELENKLKAENTTYFEIDFTQDIWAQIFEILFENQIQSLIIEGGKNVLDQLIEKNYWDEARIITSKSKFLNTGLKAPEFKGKLQQRFDVLDDEICIFRNE